MNICSRIISAELPKLEENDGFTIEQLLLAVCHNADIYLFFVCARLRSMFHQGVRILTPWFHLYLASENGNVSKVGGFFASLNIKSLFQELP